MYATNVRLMNNTGSRIMVVRKDPYLLC